MMGKNPSYKDLKRRGERYSGNKFVVFQELKEKESVCGRKVVR